MFVLFISDKLNSQCKAKQINSRIWDLFSLKNLQFSEYTLTSVDMIKDIRYYTIDLIIDT